MLLQQQECAVYGRHSRAVARRVLKCSVLVVLWAARPALSESHTDAPRQPTPQAEAQELLSKTAVEREL